MQVARATTTFFFFQMAMLVRKTQGDEEVKEHSDLRAKHEQQQRSRKGQVPKDLDERAKRYPDQSATESLLTNVEITKAFGFK
jgi:hypothetical protein